MKPRTKRHDAPGWLRAFGHGVVLAALAWQANLAYATQEVGVPGLFSISLNRGQHLDFEASLPATTSGGVSTHYRTATRRSAEPETPPSANPFAHSMTLAAAAPSAFILPQDPPAASEPAPSFEPVVKTIKIPVWILTLAVFQPNTDRMKLQVHTFESLGDCLAAVPYVKRHHRLFGDRWTSKCKRTHKQKQVMLTGPF